MQANDEKMLGPIFTKCISPAIVHQILLDLEISYNFVPYSKQTLIFL